MHKFGIPFSRAAKRANPTRKRQPNPNQSERDKITPAIKTPTNEDHLPEQEAPPAIIVIVTTDLVTRQEDPPAPPEELLAKRAQMRPRVNHLYTKGKQQSLD